MKERERDVQSGRKLAFDKNIALENVNYSSCKESGWRNQQKELEEVKGSSTQETRLLKEEKHCNAFWD